MDLLQRYQDLSIVQEGHFELAHGQHAQFYIDKDRIYRSKAFFNTVFELARACETLDLPRSFVVTGPAVAGAILAAPVWAEIQYQYPHRVISFVYPEKIDGQMTFRRGYDKHLDGKQVIIIEDIITTEASVLQTADAIIACGGRIIGSVCIWNRATRTPERFPNIALINQSIPTWSKDDCPLCWANEVPLSNPKGGNHGQSS